MKYKNEVILKDDVKCLIRNMNENDAAESIRNFVITHTETDFLISYPDEIRLTIEEEAIILKMCSKNDNAVKIAAFIDNRIVGTADIDSISNKEKLCHRAIFGIAVEKAYWGRGIGRALTLACIECAKKAGYLQIELEVVADNNTAIRLYKSVGFHEYGRIFRGYQARNGWQTLILMSLKLD